MTSEYYEQYKVLSKREILDIILSAKDYQPEAVNAARQIISEKGWITDLEKVLQQKKEEEKEKQVEEQQTILENSEYYKKAVEFKRQKHSFQVRFADIPRFEAALSDRNISFFREDKNVRAVFEIYPAQTYFFRDEDVIAVDKLTKELVLVDNPYMDVKPFAWFEIKTYLIAIVVVVALIILASLLKL
jgi:hypothetical protein